MKKIIISKVIVPLLTIFMLIGIAGCNEQKATTDSLSTRLAQAENRIDQLESLVAKSTTGSWVLWTYKWPNDVKFLPARPPTIPESAFQSKSECDAAVKARFQVGQDAIVSNEPLQVRGPTQTITYYCLPANVDPRQK